MSRKYSIALLEDFWDPEDFDAAGYLLDMVEHSAPAPLEKGLYTIRFEGDGIIEAEIKLTGRHVVKTTCDCADFSSHAKCAHILAGLILLRKGLSDKKSTKARKKPSRAMNIKTALNNVHLNELKLFCQDYARQDNAFALLLKARFVRTLSSDSFPGKYDKLLGQLVKIDRTGKVRLNRSERRTLSFMVESMLHHFDEAMVDKLYTEAFEIISSILTRLHMTVDRNEEYAEFFREEIMTTYEKLMVCLQAPIAPELKQTAFHFCLDLAGRSRYRIMDFYFNAVSVILQTAIDLHVYPALFSLVAGKIDGEEKSGNPWLPIAAMMYFQADSGREAKELFHRVEQASFAVAIEDLDKLQEYQCIVWLFEHVDISVFRIKNRVRIYRKVFEAAGHLGLPELQETCGMELMILLRDISYLEALLHNPEIPAGRIEMSAEERIGEELDGEPKVKLLAEFFIACGKQTELLELMVQKGDIDFFIRFDVHLLPGLKHELTKAYLNLIEDHLNHYAGNVNVDMIQKWRQHFEMLNLNSEIEEVLSKLEEAHPERKILFGNMKKR